MPTYDRIAGLQLHVEGYTLDGLSRTVSSGFERVSTVIRLHGAGETGVGEDVVYDADDQRRQQALGPVLDLAGTFTLDEFSTHLAGLDLFPAQASEVAVFRNYRQWGFESAALDLALRQAGASLPGALGREPRPVRFVVSSRLGEPPTFGPVERRLTVYPDLRFKLDATPDWDDALIARLVETSAVDSIDFKGAYRGTAVDVVTDPELYRRVAEAFPDAWLEDPDLTLPTADAALEPYRDRITWDAPIHSVADIEALAFPPNTVNLKPSRFGSLRSLFAGYDFCVERGIGAYGGGQYELGPGRGQIQALASLFHPDGPNDIAPGGYDDLDPAPGLPESPLGPAFEPIGFRWSAGI